MHEDKKARHFRPGLFFVNHALTLMVLIRSFRFQL
jgi:hypothetical protein